MERQDEIIYDSHKQSWSLKFEPLAKLLYLKILDICLYISKE